MDKQELLEEKEKLEQEILVFTSKKVEEFFEKTGVGLSGIRVSLTDVSTFGELPGASMVSNVSVSLAI